MAPGRLRPPWAPAVAGVCWLFFDGFVINSGAELAWRHDDRWILVVPLVAAPATAAVGALPRSRRVSTGR